MLWSHRYLGAGIPSAILFGKFSGEQGKGQTQKRTAGNGWIWSFKTGA